MLDLSPVKRPRLSSEILARLQQGIRDGVLNVGDKLPSERELAESMGVSRNSVREAIRALEALGVIEVRHGDGTFIREPDVASLLGPYFDVLHEKGTFLKEVLEFRRLLEPSLAHLAAERATDDDLQDFRYLWGEGRPARSAEAHRAVFEAISGRDAEAAAKAMEEHIRGVENLVLAELENSEKRVSAS